MAERRYGAQPEAGAGLRDDVVPTMTSICRYVARSDHAHHSRARFEYHFRSYMFSQSAALSVVFAGNNW
jgi:hypothetical protein